MWRLDEIHKGASVDRKEKEVQDKNLGYFCAEVGKMRQN